jgi:hypothetical protein
VFRNVDKTMEEAFLVDLNMEQKLSEVIVMTVTNCMCTGVIRCLSVPGHSRRFRRFCQISLIHDSNYIPVHSHSTNTIANVP